MVNCCQMYSKVAFRSYSCYPARTLLRFLFKDSLNLFRVVKGVTIQ